MHKVTGVKKTPNTNILAPEVPPEIKLKSKLSGFSGGVGLERKILNRKRHDNNKELNLITNVFGSYPSQNT